MGIMLICLVIQNFATVGGFLTFMVSGSQLIIFFTSDFSAVCNPGYYSTIHGVEPCVECPMDTYQDNEQRTQCHACPVGTHTASTGSTSLEDCLCEYFLD